MYHYQQHSYYEESDISLQLFLFLTELPVAKHCAHKALLFFRYILCVVNTLSVSNSVNIQIWVFPLLLISLYLLEISNSNMFLEFKVTQVTEVVLLYFLRQKSRHMFMFL